RAGAGCLAAAAIAAFAYGMTLSPSVGAGDSGELILAAHSLGIPHPPGYPVWLLLARLADLLPWGTVALRVNALSALLAAARAGVPRRRHLLFSGGHGTARPPDADLSRPRALGVGSEAPSHAWALRLRASLGRRGVLDPVPPPRPERRASVAGLGPGPKLH